MCWHDEGDQVRDQVPAARGETKREGGDGNGERERERERGGEREREGKHDGIGKREWGERSLGREKCDVISNKASCVVLV